MRMQAKKLTRRGTIVPAMALFIMGLLGMVALAVDIGLIAIARTEAQNCADAAALSGARMLDGRADYQYNIAQSVSTAKQVAGYNKILNQSVQPSEVSIKTGVYRYNTTLQRFEVDPSSFTSNSSGTPSNGTWTASQATINVSSPTYFARVFGINSFSVNAEAMAVHRPRDIALVLDFSGSMRFSSQSHWPETGSVSGSLNPDPVWPKFGHYSRYVGLATTGPNPMQRTTNFTMGSGENNSPNNQTIETNNGPPVIGSANDPDKQYFLTKSSSGGFSSAWNYPQNGGYNPYQTPVAQPAPDSFETDEAGGYHGDKQPRKIRAVSGSAWAATVQEHLTGATSALANNHGRGVGDPQDSLINSDVDAFDRITGDDNGYGRNFLGYSMGPGYWGKTFWMWPPDPRYDPNAAPQSPSATQPARDTSGRWMGDWRSRFFVFGSSHVNAGKRVDDNSVLFDSNGYLRQQSSTGFQVDYTAIVRWLTAGPQVLPTNLRAGRVLYYDSIPSTIPSSGGTLDQVFWRNYINYVLGIESSNLGQRAFYGREPTNWQVSTKITAKSSLLSAGNRAPTDGVSPPAPYMHYADNPKRPRAHFWFGPLTMLMFITESNQNDANMWPGTCSEAQTWQLKAGVQSAIDDVKKNHPNDWLALIYFSNLSGYNTPRVKLGQNYTKMKNALWFPFSTLDNLGNPGTEIRPYNSSFGYTAGGNIPNGSGGTCPEMGLKLAYNEFSMASGYNGRKGAAKVVILETDGVPNHSCGGTLSSAGAYFSTYGSTSSIGSTTNHGNNDPNAVNPALALATQITNPDTASGRGFSSTRTPARIHAIAFGDLFETSTTRRTEALNFLVNLQINGKTSQAGATSIEPYKIIVGDYNTRIDNLRQAFERIMQSGVQVTLIR